uniref:BAAT/Acyl-CoA thioester hydrolase C-terminal domain-containing protein n=1 Tax=Fundulus heteroclitus TaxID=8078 RepID=A0A3Q2P7B6_FUNHE
MSSFLFGISAAVCINGYDANTMIPLHYKKLYFLPLTPILKNVKVSPSEFQDIHKALPDPSLENNKASLIPKERASCQFLFASSEDDHNWNSVFLQSFQLVTCPKAGHCLDVPSSRATWPTRTPVREIHSFQDILTYF